MSMRTDLIEILDLNHPGGPLTDPNEREDTYGSQADAILGWMDENV